MITIPGVVIAQAVLLPCASMCCQSIHAADQQCSALVFLLMHPKACMLKPYSRVEFKAAYGCRHISTGLRHREFSLPLVGCQNSESAVNGMK
jgi:hypothetical protein